MLELPKWKRRMRLYRIFTRQNPITTNILNEYTGTHHKQNYGQTALVLLIPLRMKVLLWEMIEYWFAHILPLRHEFGECEPLR